LPGSEEEDATAERTRLALEALLNGTQHRCRACTTNIRDRLCNAPAGKIAKAKPTGAVTHAESTKEPQYIRYTANPDVPGYNPDLQQRVIRLAWRVHLGLSLWEEVLAQGYISPVVHVIVHTEKPYR